MKLLFSIVLFICALANVFCNQDNATNKLTLEIYQAYLIGTVIIFMFILIIILIILLYMVRNNKTLFGINVNKTRVFVRQESGQGVTSCSYGNIGNDMCKNDGSTLTVNSGIVEVHGLVEPETPTHMEPRHEIKPPTMKKPILPIIAPLQKAQMDDIIKEVLLNKRQERGSTTLRAIEASLKNLDVQSNEALYVNLPATETRKQPVHKYKNNAAEKTVVDGKNNLDTNITVDDEPEVYDTLPNPIRCINRNSNDDDLVNLPIYDSPPRRNWENDECKNAVLDQDTDYILLLSPPNRDDKTSYINAKLRESH